MSHSITTLENNVNSFVKKLKGLGLDTSIDTFKDGTRGGSYGGSYVELTVSGDDYWNTFTFYSVYGGEYNGCMKWSEMKQKCMDVLSEINGPLNMNSPE